MDVYWNGAKGITYTSDDLTGTKIMRQETMFETQPAGQWFSFTVWTRIAINQASGLFTYYGKASSAISVTPSYPVAWELSMNPKIYICSDVNGANSVKCQATNVKAWYQSPYFDQQAREGTTPKLFALYKLDQHTGYVINDSANILGPGYFGSSTSSAEDPVAANKPSWLPEVDPVTGQLVKEVGLQFDQSTEYVTLPTFDIAKSLQTPAYSFTLKFWIKLSVTPTSEVYIFRYSQSNLVTDCYALKVQTDKRIKIINYDKSISSSHLLLVSSWSSVIATFANMKYISAPTSPNPYTYMTIIIDNQINDVSVQLTPLIHYTYDSTNIVRIGGPPTVLGIIADFEIYNPGTGLISTTTACQYSTCSRDLGIMNPPVCGVPQCPASCSICFSSGDAGCLSCSSSYKLYESKCYSMSCPFGKYLDGSNVCQNCIEHCDVCSDGISCTTCNSTFINQGSICACPSDSYLDSTTDSCKPGTPLCSNPSDFFYPNDNSCRATCEYPFKVVSVDSIKYCYLDIDEKDAEQAKQIAKVSSIASDAANMGGILINILTSNNPTLLLTGSLTEMLQYIQYLKINYPPKVQLMLDEQNVNSGGLSIITQIPDQVAEAIPNRPLPEEFEKNDTQSSFVANNWQLLITLSAIIVVICAVLVLKLFTTRFRRIDSFLSSLLQSLKWNLFLGVFCSSYGFAGMYTALEFRTVNMSAGLSIFSFITSLVINTIGFFVFFLIFQISITFNTIKKTVKNPEEQARHIEETEEKWKNYEVLFGDYKNDFTSQKMYLFIFMLRTYIHYAVLGYLNDYPFLQTCGFTIISIGMILYMIIRRPIKTRLNYLQQMICEVAILVVNICVLILAVMEKWDMVDSDTRLGVGNIIIGVNIVLSAVTTLFLVIEIISQIKEAWLFIKRWRQNTKKLKTHRMMSSPSKGLYKVQTRPQNIGLHSNNHNLDISDFERKCETSFDQLKPSIE